MDSRQQQLQSRRFTVTRPSVLRSADTPFCQRNAWIEGCLLCGHFGPAVTPSGDFARLTPGINDRRKRRFGCQQTRRSGRRHSRSIPMPSRGGDRRARDRASFPRTVNQHRCAVSPPQPDGRPTPVCAGRHYRVKSPPDSPIGLYLSAQRVVARAYASPYRR